MARMTQQDWIDMYEQAETMGFVSTRSQLGIVEVLYGRAKEAVVRDAETGDELGTFTMPKLRRAWTDMAREQGQSGIEWYESGEPDSIDYSTAFEVAIAGESIYA